MGYGRRGQYVSNSELDEKIFALIKQTGKSESKIVREVLEAHFKQCEHLWGTQSPIGNPHGIAEAICVKCGEKPNPYNP